MFSEIIILESPESFFSEEQSVLALQASQDVLTLRWPLLGSYEVLERPRVTDLCAPQTPR